MPAEEFAALWQRYIAAYAELLLEASSETPADSPTVQRLVSVLLVFADTDTGISVSLVGRFVTRRSPWGCRLRATLVTCSVCVLLRTAVPTTTILT